MNTFFTFEGIDGSGKDTHLLAFAHALKSGCTYFPGDKYKPVWLTREPTKLTLPGKEISRLLKTNAISVAEATKYFIEDRILHSMLYIVPTLQHSHVLSSRYDISTLSYQVAQGADFDDLYKLHKYASPKSSSYNGGTLVPDITFIFDIPVPEAMKRVNSRDAKKEFFEKESFQKKVFEAQDYCIDRLRELDGRTIIRINSNQPVSNTTDELFRKVTPYLSSSTLSY